MPSIKIRPAPTATNGVTEDFAPFTQFKKMLDPRFYKLIVAVYCELSTWSFTSQELLIIINYLRQICSLLSSRGTPSLLDVINLEIEEPKLFRGNLYNAPDYTTLLVYTKGTIKNMWNQFFY